MRKKSKGRPAHRPTKAALRALYIKKLKGGPEIARKFGVDKGTVMDWLRKYRIPVRSNNQAVSLAKRTKRPSQAVLRRMYLKWGMSSGQMAKEIGVTTTPVLQWLKAAEVPIRGRAVAMAAAQRSIKRWRPSSGVMKNLYLKRRMNVSQIAKKLKRADTTIQKWLREDKIRIRSRSETLTIRMMGKNWKRPSRTVLTRMYWKRQMSAREMGKELGVNASAVQRWLVMHKIPRRDAVKGHTVASEKNWMRWFRGMGGRKKRVPTRAVLHRMYHEKGMSTYDMGEALRVSQGTIRAWMRRGNIPTRSGREAALLAATK